MLWSLTTSHGTSTQFFLPDPIENDVKYQASAQPFLVFGLLTTALAIGHQNMM